MFIATLFRRLMSNLAQFKLFFFWNFVNYNFEVKLKYTNTPPPPLPPVSVVVWKKLCKCTFSFSLLTYFCYIFVNIFFVYFTRCDNSFYFFETFQIWPKTIWNKQEFKAHHFISNISLSFSLSLSLFLTPFVYTVIEAVPIWEALNVTNQISFKKNKNSCTLVCVLNAKICWFNFD